MIRKNLSFPFPLACLFIFGTIACGEKAVSPSEVKKEIKSANVKPAGNEQPAKTDVKVEAGKSDVEEEEDLEDEGVDEKAADPKEKLEDEGGW